ncbi:MAG: Ig-like domain-containing protein, partial [Candidatus Tumulicola sp.]
MRPLLGLLVAVLGVVASASCSTQPAAPAKLARVAPLAKPVLPPWIASISPTGGKVESLTQIRVIFSKPIAKVESLSGDGPRAVLEHVTIEPALKGRFAVLTPRMIGFIAEQALPVGTRVRVALTSGLRDLAGDSLASDLSWTFETESLEFSNLPQLTAADGESTPGPVGLRPKIAITANAAADAQSLAAHAAF